MINSFRDLTVWQLSMDLAERCYHVTRAFPKDELFGLASQIRRAAASIPANIAEGRGRSGTREFLHFVGIARGSLAELETHFELARRAGLVHSEAFAEMSGMATRVGQMLTALSQTLRQKVRGAK